MAEHQAGKDEADRLARAIAAGDLASASELLRERGRSAGRAGRLPGASQPPVPLAEACGGSVATAGEHGAYYVVRQAPEDVAAECLSVAREFAAVLRGARQQFDELAVSAALCHVANVRAEDLLFVAPLTCPLDEADGVCLVGMMSSRDGRFVFEQCLARDASEEAGVLAAFADRYVEAAVLVAFSGRSLRMKLLRHRADLCGVELPRRERPCLDVQREVRRLWGRELPNASLRTLERLFCGRRRTRVMRPADVRRTCEQFLATGDARGLAEVLRHNRLDLLTLAQLVVAVLTGCGPAFE